MDSGSVADWVGSVASIFSACLSVAALWVALAANRTSKEAKEENSQSNQLARELEQQRDRRSVAGMLQAWWVVSKAGGEQSDKWGVMVANVAQSATVFHDVEVTTSGNKHGRRIKIHTVPPGFYFVESCNEEGSPWALPVPLKENAWEPITKSSRHQVESIKFSDQLGDRWAWSPREGLRQSQATDCGGD